MLVPYLMLIISIDFFMMIHGEAVFGMVLFLQLKS